MCDSLKIKEIDIMVKRMEVKEITGITSEANINLYDLFIKKLSSTIYQYRPANPKDNLLKGREKFLNLGLAEQCVVLGEILHLFQCKPLSANLILIGAAGNTGVTKIGKEISRCNSAKLVSQSVTGIYEQVVDLLTI